jgi:hypothetical protein
MSLGKVGAGPVRAPAMRGNTREPRTRKSTRALKGEYVDFPLLAARAHKGEYASQTARAPRGIRRGIANDRRQSMSAWVLGDASEDQSPLHAGTGSRRWRRPTLLNDIFDNSLNANPTERKQNENKNMQQTSNMQAACRGRKQDEATRACNKQAKCKPEAKTIRGGRSRNTKYSPNKM